MFLIMKDGRAINAAALIVELRPNPAYEGDDLIATAFGVEYVLAERVGEQALRIWLENLHRASDRGFAHAIEISATQVCAAGDTVSFH
jgi:hypothetical protein